MTPEERNRRTLFGDYTDKEVRAAIAREPLLNKRINPTAPDAIRSLARSLFEHEINDILHMPDEDIEWSKLATHHRQRYLANACWHIGRLRLNGIQVVTAHESLCT